MLHPALRAQIADLNRMLASSGLVKGTSGNVSGRDPETGDIAIKPSGVSFQDITAESIVVLNAQGQVIDGDLRPSVDSASHLSVYRHRPDIGGIVHTHSKYATAFAVAGLPLPATTTTHACLFGGDIPVSGLVEIGEEQIGQAIIQGIGSAQAILMRNHGVFAIGPNANTAFRHAVYVEESAESTFLARQLDPTVEPLGKDFCQACRTMYVNDYGQK
jgi:L-ribulose-5-phosphate 4-epimerase